MPAVSFNRDNKYDIQLSQALRDESALARIFAGAKIELKTESFLWERTGNICIEFASRGKPSGIAVTEADYWVHQLVRDDKTVVYLMFPIDRLRALCARARIKHGIGDDKSQSAYLIPIADIVK